VIDIIPIPFSTIAFGFSTSLRLPKSLDPEGLGFSTTISSKQSFFSYDSVSQILTINPTNCATDLGIATV
jgi:hypothetical protein